MRIAAVTMVYNEPEYIPIWLQYYGRQLGFENCFIIDHGSDDGSCDRITCGGLWRLPRTPQDEVKRIDTVSNIISSLLNYYDAAIYTDVDEILVPRPSVYRGLRDFCDLMQVDTVTAIGLNVHHSPADEPDFDIDKPVLHQRKWVRFVSPMCKPLITRKPVRWNRGFHSTQMPPAVFADLYLFHLRWFDLKIGLNRLRRTRVAPRATEGDARAAQHQRLADNEFERILLSAAGMKREEPIFSLTADPIRSLIEKVTENGNVTMDVFENALWRIPAEFFPVF